MIDFAENLERFARHLNPMLLIASGLALLLTGAFVWLGGLGFRKILFAVIGAASAVAFGFFISGWNILLAAAMVGLAVFIAVKLDDIFIVIVASVLAAVVGFSYLISPYIKPSEDLYPIIQQVVFDVPYYNWFLLLLFIVIPIVGKFYCPSFFTALVCSAMGTFMAAAGIIFVGLYRGVSSFRYISNRYSLYLGTFLAVIALGTVEQLFFVRTVKAIKGPRVPKIKPKKQKKSKTNPDKQPDQNAPQEPEQVAATTSWRTS